MNDLIVLVPLLLAAVVALAIVVFIRVSSAALRRARGATRHEAELASLASRLGGALDEVMELAAPIREDRAPAADLGNRVSTAERDARAVADAAAHLGLRDAPSLAPGRERLVAAAEQACAALGGLSRIAAELAPQDGAAPVPPDDQGSADDRRRSLERAMKRTYLDLAHARAEAAAVSRAGASGAGRASGAGEA